MVAVPPSNSCLRPCNGDYKEYWRVDRLVQWMSGVNDLSEAERGRLVWEHVARPSQNMQLRCGGQAVNGLLETRVNTERLG